MKYLETAYKVLLELWAERQENYEEHLDSQKFRRDAEQAEAWIAAQEALLKNEDIGVSVFVIFLYCVLYLSFVYYFMLLSCFICRTH